MCMVDGMTIGRWNSQGYFLKFLIIISKTYYRGQSESMKKVCSRHGVHVYFKGGNTIKNLLVTPKDQDPILKKSGVIYRYKCDRVECDEEYIGEFSRVLGKRLKEHATKYNLINMATTSAKAIRSVYTYGITSAIFNN